MPKENHVLEKRQEARGTVGKVKANQSKIRHHHVSMLLCIYIYGCKHTESTSNIYSYSSLIAYFQQSYTLYTVRAGAHTHANRGLDHLGSEWYGNAMSLINGSNVFF